MRHHEALEMVSDHLDEECQTAHHKGRPNTDSHSLNMPSRQHRSFRYGDIDHKRIVARRPYRYLTTRTIEIAGRSIVSPTLGDYLVPGRLWRYLRAGAILGIRVAHD